MSGDFIVNDHNLREDFSLIKKLEYQHLRLEEKAAKSKQEQKLFCAHPKRILSDSESTASSSSRSAVNGGCSPVHAEILHSENDQSVYQERKKKAQTIRKKLHEKLSVIGQCGHQQSETAAIGDHANVSKEILNDRFRTLPIHGGYDTSSGDSVDFDDVYSTRKNDKPTKPKIAKNSDQQKPKSPSKVQGCYNKGLTILDYEKKCKIVLEKSVQTIIDIRTTLAKGVTPPDGQEDELRRAVRIKEFFNRFSRNYLYPLSRQVKELSGPLQLAEALAKQKLLASHQIVLNGLQAYHSHLTTSGGDTSFNQLKILMSNIMEICDLHRGINKSDNYINEFIDSLKLSAELTLQHVGELHSKQAVASATESALKSEASNLSLSKYGMSSNRKQTSSRKGSKNGKTRSVPDKRYSMYTVTASFRKDAPWKKTVENLAKKKFNVKSKYKTATYKHRPPLQKSPDIISLPQLKIINSKNSGALNGTPIQTPINEDAIKTMVQELDDNRDVEKLKDQENPKEEMLIKLLQYTLRQHQEGKCVEDNHLTEILKLMQNEQNIDDIKTILGRVVNEKKESNGQQNLTLKITQSDCTDLSSGVRSSREKSKRKEPTITVTGEKNVRLICITDDNSIVEPQAEPEPTIENVCQTDDVEPAKILIRPSSETQTDFNSQCPKVSKVTQKSKQNTCIKISRLKKSFRQLPHLNKNQALSAIQYKLDFYRYCKSNPMYKKSTSCQPWLLMNKISEEILNHCLLAVAGEIEVNDIVDRVYQAELQL